MYNIFFKERNTVSPSRSPHKSSKHINARWPILPSKNHPTGDAVFRAERVRP